MDLIQNHSLLDTLLRQWHPQLGKDFERYRNHCYRVVNHCVRLSPLNKEQFEQVIIAACFHDVGIWLDNTFDYLKPSQHRANNYLVREGKSQWSEAVCRMILEHHKITAYTGNHQLLVETFRKADWIDVSMGFLTFSLNKKEINTIRKAFPYLGFHKMLTTLTTKNMLHHPLNPLPMFKL